MKVYLTNQRSKLPNLLPDFKKLPLSYDNLTPLRERKTVLIISLPTPGDDLSQYNFDFLFRYHIFPSNILVAAAEWEPEGRTMNAGDVIVQQAFLPPMPVSLKVVFAVRVLEVFCSSTKVGFSYGTLKGHPETGISEFSFSLQGQELCAAIHTHSAPGILISRLVAPIFTLPYQQYCTRRALQQMRDHFLASNF